MPPILTLGPPPIRTPLAVESNAVAIREGSPMGKWMNLVHQILEGVGPLIVRYDPVTRAAAAMLPLENIPIFADNATAIAAGMVAGQLYRTGGNPDFIAVVN